MTDKVHNDISQRSYDDKYIVWEQLYLDAPVTECVNRKAYILPRWVCTNIFKNKTGATQYCKERFGRNCFKENEQVSIVFV